MGQSSAISLAAAWPARPSTAMAEIMTTPSIFLLAIIGAPFISDFLEYKKYQEISRWFEIRDLSGQENSALKKINEDDEGINNRISEMRAGFLQTPTNNKEKNKI